MGLLNFFSNLFTKKNNNNNSNNNKIKRKKKNSTLVFKNTKYNKNFRIPNKTFTLAEFNKKYSYSSGRLPIFRKGTQPKTHLQIMFDPNVPNGENSYGNQVFVHYLKLGKKIFFEYYPPNPAKGTHNYHCMSIYIENRQQKELLYKILKSANERKHPIFQGLKKNPMALGEIKIYPENILLENHFKVKN